MSGAMYLHYPGILLANNDCPDEIMWMHKEA